MRLTDSHRPLLPFMASTYNSAHIETIEFCKVWQMKNPDADPRPLDMLINAFFQRRLKDCVSDLACAAAMILPSAVYGREVIDRPFVPANGDACFRAIINSYYGADAENARRVEALLQYTWFRQCNPGSAGSPSFWRSPEARIAGRGLEDDIPDRFWTLASSMHPLWLRLQGNSAMGTQGRDHLSAATRTWRTCGRRHATVSPTK
jgi:hypothetical protein